MYGLLTLIAIAIALTIVLLACHKFHVLTVVMTWIKSTTEEKVGLTKLVGHFNANGYLVHSDSDIYIGHSGSFKRFESFDKDIRIATTSFITGSEWGVPENEESSIPPQPLRPAPIPIAKDMRQEDKSIIPPVVTPTIMGPPILETLPMETSIKPLPRPVSSINMSTLQQSNAQFIQPPPTHGRASVSGPCTAAANSAVSRLTNIDETTNPGFKQMPRQIDMTISANRMPAVTTSGGTAPPAARATGGEFPDVISGALKRAISCESVCSDTSVALGDLEESNVTGYLCIALEYDSENGEMIANVLEAKDLVNPGYAIGGAAAKHDPMDTYVKIFLLPDKSVNVQTKVYRNSNSPSYQERVIFGLHPRDQMNTALLFHIYAADMCAHTLIGEGELSLADVSLRQPVTTWVTLTDTSLAGTEFGELMFSLSYLPTAERLTVVVVKGRKLKFQSEKDPGDSFVKAYMLQNGKKIHKKKTSTKKSERSPIFNESMMFNIPAHMLQTIQIRLTVAELQPEAAKAHSIGHVIVGAQASGRPLAHWNQMLQALRRPVAMWHPLRK